MVLSQRISGKILFFYPPGRIPFVSGCVSFKRHMHTLLYSSTFEKEAKRDRSFDLKICFSILPLFDDSGMLTAAPKAFHCPDPEKNCNPCLDAAKACNLNGSCKRQRSSYIATCSKEDPNKGDTCSKKRCHKALRLFLDRVPPEFSHRLLFCPCQTEGCAERRRQTIVPDCSYKDKEKPNCLELRKVCRQDSLCR